MIRKIRKIIGLVTNDTKLPIVSNGKTGRIIISSRIRMRYDNVKQRFNGTPERINFEKLFNLPYWITFDEWLRIQLRGREIDSLFLLTIDHIVPLSQARNVDELIKLFSWKNTRLLDESINHDKSSQIDNEVRLLCKELLGRFPDNDISYSQKYRLFKNKTKTVKNKTVIKNKWIVTVSLKKWLKKHPALKTKIINNCSRCGIPLEYNNYQPWRIQNEFGVKIPDCIFCGKKHGSVSYVNNGFLKNIIEIIDVVSGYEK